MPDPAPDGRPRLRQVLLAWPPRGRQAIAWLFLVAPAVAIVFGLVLDDISWKIAIFVLAAAFYFWWLPWVWKPILLGRRPRRRPERLGRVRRRLRRA